MAEQQQKRGERGERGGERGERGGERGERGGERGERGGGKKGGGRGGNKEKESEWQERVVQTRRVTKVVKGGKKLSFRAVVIVGNQRGQVGVGVGKAADVMGAIKKGVADGKKHLIQVPMTKSNSIPHLVNAAGGGASVIIRPASPGTGVIAGGAVRTVLEMAGVRNVLAKQLGSGNPLNNARAAITALKSLRTLADVAQERGIPVEQLYG